MSEQDSKKIQLLHKQGMITDAYVSFLSKNTESASIAASALLASVEAREYAFQTGIPLIVAEEGVLYEEFQDGTKKFIQDLPKSTRKFPKKFKLK
ncbi:MAG: hypothetical protein K0S33_265 [Bacteroidetes bacterium]|jgi:hypothetical protein|nr:hypothetical protein [Bacteroidota bacterium]